MQWLSAGHVNAVISRTRSPVVQSAPRRAHASRTAEMARHRLRLVAGGRHSRRPGCRGHAIDRRRSPTFAAGPWPATWVRPACVEPDGLRHRVLEDQWLLPAAATATVTTVTAGQHHRQDDANEISTSVFVSNVDDASVITISTSCYIKHVRTPSTVQRRNLT